MKLDNQWQIVFCSQCSEPTPPKQLQKPFKSDGLYCPECIDDLFNNSETFEPVQIPV